MAGLFEQDVLAYEPSAVEFWVPGRPQTAGSKGAFKHPTTGRIIVTESAKGDAKKAKQGWRGDLRDACSAAMLAGELDAFAKETALEASFVFVLARPGGHFGTGRNAGVIKAWARVLRPTTIPDVLKLARAAEDALKGVAYVDDSSIVSERLEKLYSDQAGIAHGLEGMACRIAQVARSSLPAELVARSLRRVPDGPGGL